MLVKSMICHEISEDIGSLSLEDVDLPPPGDDEVQIRVRACAANFTDILMIQGKYQFKPPLPFAPGGEFAGDVLAVGKNVAQRRPGDSIVASARYGGFSEAINVPQESVRTIPDGVSYEKAACYQSAYHTALVALKIRGQLKPGETLLVHGATGGVGMAAVDLGKQMGATVIATGGSDEKLAVVARRGADHIINYTQPDGRLGGFRQRVKQLTGGHGADVIFDPVGGSVFDESMRCINWGGRLLTIGFTSGVWPQAPVNLILIKQISVIGVRAGEMGRRNPALGQQTRDELYELLERGVIDPYVCASYPLADAVAALRLLEERRVIGRAVVTAGSSPSPSGDSLP